MSETSQAVIRSADPERDGAACAAIYAPHVEGSAVSFEEQAPDAAELAARIRRVSATHPWLVAELGGEVVGYAYACRHRERPAYRWAADVSVYVAAAQVGRGIGRLLYTELFEQLRGQRFRLACAGITLPNPASVALHESLGFALVGVNRRIGWKQGAWRDVGWWQLELAPPGENPPPEPLPPS
ncbi:MAG TPA: GNAT family N-acetyltransferase [Solirubrobacterales bacterium]|jgi:phosphinothricin acetyltransferase